MFIMIFRFPGLRKTMLRAHRQAWCWQDEYYGLELSDIRRLERETQLALAEKMKIASDDEEEGEDNTETPKIPISTSFDQAAAIKRQTSESDPQGKITTETRKPSAGTIHKRSLSGSAKLKGGQCKCSLSGITQVQRESLLKFTHHY